MTPTTSTTPASAPSPAQARAAKARGKKAAPAKERPTGQRRAAPAKTGGSPASHSEQLPDAPTPTSTPAPAPATRPGKERPAKKEKAAPAKPAKPRRLSALDAAAIVLAKSGKPMKASDMIEAMASQGLWASPGGKTPEATLYAAIIREIAAKKHESRFKKHDRGLFVATHEGV